MSVAEFAKLTLPTDEVRTSVEGVLQSVAHTLEKPDLGSLIRALSVNLGNKEQNRPKGAVSIMTMHQAKGLSAEAVFVIAAEDEYIPGRAVGREIEDERRLLYVSMTRARRFLFVSHCQRRVDRQLYTGRTRGKPFRNLTRFLADGPVRSQPAN